jgi:16S rRNA (cytidine1402-2'-O)-methyltransferase
MSTLYLVATPIGNLDDITLRALRVLGDASVIAAEDTRSARVLLRRHGIEHARVTSYTDHNKRAKTPLLLRALGEGDVALISDAGMPGISDPGHDLVVAALDAGHEVVPVPGASAVIAAVAASGLPSRRFHYLGFLPRTSGARRRALRDAAASGDTLVVYESPHRLRATLADAMAALGDRRIAVCRELTKVYEEIWRGTVSGAIEHFAAPRGEFTLVIEGGPHPLAPSPSRAEKGKGAEVTRTVARLRKRGATARDAVAELSRAHGLSRREAYRLWQQPD